MLDVIILLAAEEGNDIKMHIGCPENLKTVIDEENPLMMCQVRP